MSDEIKELTMSEQRKVLYMKREELLQLSTKELKRIIITTATTPAHKRFAAVRLYKLGETDFAISFLIGQMNLYKDPETHRNTINETCTSTAEELGRLKDPRAIEPLFEALDALGYSAAYGLAKIDGPDIEKRLLEISKADTREGIYASIALGYMKNETIVRRLIHFLEHAKELKEMFKDTWLGFHVAYVINILGAYKNNREAEEAFRKVLNRLYISFILRDYLVQNDYPESRDLEWEIVKKYNWDKYIDTDAKKFAFSFRDISWWSEDFKTPCPFKSDAEIIKLREEVAENILQDMKRND